MHPPAPSARSRARNPAFPLPASISYSIPARKLVKALGKESPASPPMAPYDNYEHAEYDDDQYYGKDDACRLGTRRALF